MSGTHKIYVGSRARVNPGTTSHNKFVWQAPRPINVPNCRAFIDSVHLPVAWGTFHDKNQYIYISEQLDGWNVSSANDKLYLYETYGTAESIRVASIAQFPYTTGAALRPQYRQLSKRTVSFQARVVSRFQVQGREY